MTNHPLDNCRALLAKPVDERKMFIRENKLCYGCLDVGHCSKKCKKRHVVMLKCSTCDKSHPTSLHGDRRFEKLTEYKRPKRAEQDKGIERSSETDQVKVGQEQLQETKWQNRVKLSFI